MALTPIIDQQAFRDAQMHFLKVDLSAAFDKVMHSAVHGSVACSSRIFGRAMLRCFTFVTVSLKWKQMEAKAWAKNGVRQGLSDSAWLFVLLGPYLWPIGQS